MERLSYNPPNSYGRILFAKYGIHYDNGLPSDIQLPPYKRKLIIPSGISLFLHSLALMSLISLANPHDSKGERGQYGGSASNKKIVSAFVAEPPKRLEQLAGESGSLPERMFYNLQAKLGPETKDTNLSKSSDVARMLESEAPRNYSLEEKLRQVILNGRSPNELYAPANSAGKRDTIDYTDFLMAYIKEYLALKLDPLLVGDITVRAYKIDIRMHVLARIDENGKIRLLQYTLPPVSKKLEYFIANDMINQLKGMPNFIPPSKANLKSPYQFKFRFLCSYKTWEEVGAFFDGKFKWMPIR